MSCGVRDDFCTVEGCKGTSPKSGLKRKHQCENPKLGTNRFTGHQDQCHQKRKCEGSHEQHKVTKHHIVWSPEGPAFISKCSEKPGKVQNVMSSDMVCKEVTLIASSTRDQVVSTLLIEANYFFFVHSQYLIHVSIKIFVLLSLPWVAPATVQVPCRQNLALICPVPPP